VGHIPNKKDTSKIIQTGVARVPMVVREAFYSRLDVCTGLCKLLFQTQFLSNENKKNTILSYNIADNSKRVKRNEEKVCVCVFGCWMVIGFLHILKKTTTYAISPYHH
jgi:hypothetical protein